MEENFQHSVLLRIPLLEVTSWHPHSECHVLHKNEQNFLKSFVSQQKKGTGYYWLYIKMDWICALY